MSEEIRKQGAEISDAALEGVSGGLTYPSNLRDRARMICGDCKKAYRGKHACSGNPDKLEQYMRKNGAISNMSECPYR